MTPEQFQRLEAALHAVARSNNRSFSALILFFAFLLHFGIDFNDQQSTRSGSNSESGLAAMEAGK